MESSPIHVFTSHIEGKNATVSIYSDRLEWVKPRGISGGKITAGLLTAGVSLLATGVKGGKSGTEMIPVKSINSVTTKRDGMINSKVVVVTSGNTIEFRVSHSEANEVKDVLTRLILGTHPSQLASSANAAAPAPTQTATAQQSEDIPAQIGKLSELRDAGILTEEEFSQKKADLLGRM